MLINKKILRLNRMILTETRHAYNILIKMKLYSIDNYKADDDAEI